MVTLLFSPPNTQTVAKNHAHRDPLTGTQITGTGDHGTLHLSKGPHHGDPRRHPNKHQNPAGANKKQTAAQKGRTVNVDLPVTQINLHRAKIAWPTLVASIIGDLTPLVLATEPYVDSNNIIPPVHKDLTSLYCKEGDTRPRAAIVIHNQLLDKGWELSQFTSSDLVAIKLKLGGGEVVVVSAYIMYYMDGKPAIWQPLLVS